MSRKCIYCFDVVDAKTGETLQADFALTDCGELLKKNAKGVWLPVPAKGDLVVRLDVETARRW